MSLPVGYSLAAASPLHLLVCFFDSLAARAAFEAASSSTARTSVIAESHTSKLSRGPPDQNSSQREPAKMPVGRKGDPGRIFVPGTIAAARQPTPQLTRTRTQSLTTLAAL